MAIMTKTPDPNSQPPGKPKHVPDFIIAGAMKCGTTWLHDALNRVDGVFIPRDEVHWIDAHDPISHPDFHTVTAQGLKLRRGPETRWFVDTPKEAAEARFYGYDSTTLCHAQIDLAALAADMPETRVIVVLRNPVSRAFSHYWHLVRTGRASHPFETEILHGKQEILHRSLYADAVLRLQAAFGDRVLFVCYERIFAEPQTELSRVVDFLGLPDGAVEAMHEHLTVRSNPGRYPRFLPGWLFAARLLSGWERGRYAQEVLPQGQDRGVRQRVARALYFAKLGAMVLAAGGIHRSSPKMKPQTREELEMYFGAANARLDNSLGPEFTRLWQGTARRPAEATGKPAA